MFREFNTLRAGYLNLQRAGQRLLHLFVLQDTIHLGHVRVGLADVLDIRVEEVAVGLLKEVDLDLVDVVMIAYPLRPLLQDKIPNIRLHPSETLVHA